jgi:hypothetical protein
MSFESRHWVGSLQDFNVLRVAEGVMRVSMPPGQILLYRGHVPLGLYLILKGALELESGADAASLPGHLLDAKKGAFLFPGFFHMNEPFPTNALVTRKIEFLFIPRSVIHSDLQVRRYLENIS